MSSVYRKGLTELHSGVGPGNEPPKVSIVFIHGLGGHPQRTWTATGVASGSVSSDRRQSDSSDATGSTRKGSLWNKFFKASKAGLADRTMSIAQSTYSVDAPSVAVSPPEVNVDPLTAEPEAMSSPALSPRGQFSNPLSRTPSNVTVPLATPSSGKRQTFWPHDLLPSDIPSATIYTYGYDADVVKKPFTKDSDLSKDSDADNEAERSTEPKSKFNFTQLAHELLVALNRELPNDVPIILCAHSLGGVLTKRALWESRTHTRDPLKQKLSKLTKAVFFFGTPHKGSSTASWGRIGANIASMIKIEATSKLVGKLQLDSEVLDLYHSDFMRLLAEGRFWVHTFQESKPLNNVIGKVVEDFSSKIDETPLQQYEKLDGNHRTMIQFRSAQEDGYRSIVGALKYYMTMLDAKHDAERRSIASDHSAKSIQTPTYYSLPYGRNDDFTGRVSTMEAINMLFAPPKNASFVALHGLGGIGKTQVAIELAERFKKFFPSYSIFWVHGTTEEVFDEGLRTILTELGVTHSADTNVRNLVQKWLENPSNGKWLLIIDNVDDRTVLNANKGKKLFKMLPCIPKTGHGRVLFTTRYKSVALDLTRDHVRLDPMSELEALDLLKTSFADDWEDEQTEAALKLLDELSHIPLAIVHAACYMRENSTPIARYLKMYRESEESREELLEDEIAGLGITDEETPKTVLNTTWMSLDRLKADVASGPLAIELLSVMAFLHRQDIPLFLLEKYMPKAGMIKLDKAFGSIKGYSLVTENTKSETLSMHRLVQLSMRRWLEQGDREGSSGKYREDAFKLVSDHFPDGSFPTWDACKALIIHADTVLENCSETDRKELRAKLLRNTANFQIGRGQYVAAEKKLVEVVELESDLVGSLHIETLQAQDQLSWCLRLQAKKDEALSLAQKTLVAKEEILGKDSTEVMTTAHIVATIIGDQGKHQEAATLHHANLEARKTILGPEHLDTLRSASNLALELWELGKFVEAEDLARETLASRTNLLGDEHPDTLEISGTLGFILEIQGKYQEALEIKSRMLEVRERVYGEDHPDTADSCHDMGWIHHQMGSYELADPYYERALSAKQRLLGDNHWKTLTTMCNFPVFFCDMGRYDEAEIRTKNLLDTLKRMQGEQHPQTLDVTGGLAVTLRHQEKLEEAAVAARMSIDGRNIVLGPDHPWTLPPVSHWGYILTLQGDCAKGEEVIRDALAKLETHMGVESSNVLISLIFLSKNLYLQATTLSNPTAPNPSIEPDDARLIEAEELAQRALASRKKMLGEDHPYYFKTMHHLAKVQFARGREDEAIERAKQALNGFRRVLGQGLDVEHPDGSRMWLEIVEMEDKRSAGGLQEVHAS